MLLKNGRHIDKFVTDSWGSQGYVFWIENCYDPCIYFVRGESFDDAYGWFVCHPPVEAQLKVEDYYEDYIEGWDPQWVEGIGNTNKATLKDLEEAYVNNKTTVIELNDNGEIIDAEAVNGMSLKEFARAL